MKDKKEKKGFLESFSDFMSDPEGISTEDLRTELIGQGVDVESLEKKVMEIVRKGSEERRLAWQKHAREQRAGIEEIFESRRLAKTAEDIRDRIMKILEGGYGHGALSYAEAYFRKKETVSERDLETLLNDLDDLKLLEELGEGKE
ncbi:MAG: hypothetical protein FJ135_01385 [Deltaproteobacteria bacterium]|nr:hypothetical protein [Deltaproteobacteria bacterium]